MATFLQIWLEEPVDAANLWLCLPGCSFILHILLPVAEAGLDVLVDLTALPPHDSVRDLELPRLLYDDVTCWQQAASSHDPQLADLRPEPLPDAFFGNYIAWGSVSLVLDYLRFFMQRGRSF